MANDEIKPIEEIKNGNGETTEAKPHAADEGKAPEASPSASSGTPQPPSPPSTPAAPKTPSSPPPAPPGAGKRAIIRRPRSPILNIILWIVLILVGLAAVFYFFFYRVTFEINPDPRPDRILLDQKEVEPGVYKVMPGVHSVVIEKEGYISYVENRQFKMAEKLKLNFKFEKEKAPTLSLEGGRYPILSSDGNLLFFLDKNSAISVLKLSDNKPVASRLSNSQYPTAKTIKISKDNSFAMVFDNEAIKIIDFSKTDLINQEEAKLPPLASAIHSVTWNNHESSFFPQANSNILYDLKTSYGWDVYLANRQHTEANMILQLSENIENPVFDWGESEDKVLVAGKELGILSIPLREFGKVESDKNFVYAKWGPNAKYAIALDSEGVVYQVGQDLTVKALPFKVSNQLISFSDENTLAGVSDGRPIKFHLDTQTLEYFSEVQGLASASSFICNEASFFYSNNQGLFSGDLAKPSYK